MLGELGSRDSIRRGWQMPQLEPLSDGYAEDLGKPSETPERPTPEELGRLMERPAEELKADGWRLGKDVLWHNRRFAGSYEIEDAMRRFRSKRGEIAWRGKRWPPKDPGWTGYAPL